MPASTDYGFIEAPYRRVDQVNKRVTNEVRYMTADEEEDYIIAQANEPLDENHWFVRERVTARSREDTVEIDRNQIDYMDVSPQQLVSVASAMIPFLENDDANRALMGANMQRQAVPLLTTDAPVVATGIEYQCRLRLRRVHPRPPRRHHREGLCRPDRAAGRRRRARYAQADQVHPLQPVHLHQPAPHRFGERARQEGRRSLRTVQSTDQGEIALGKNVLMAFMTWEGYNYEDAILISEKMVKDDILTSIHMEEYETEASETKLGPEEITRGYPQRRRGRDAATWTTAASSASAPRFARATFWWVR